MCPVAAVLAYMTKRGSQSGPLFLFSDGRPLTRLWFVQEVKEALTRAGVESSCYSRHSFQSGAATTAANQGIREPSSFWDAGGDMPTRYTYRPHGSKWLRYLKYQEKEQDQVNRGGGVGACVLSYDKCKIKIDVPTLEINSE